MLSFWSLWHRGITGPAGLVTLGFYNAKVREALYEYNKTHDEPLEDELGLVEFQVWTGTGGIG